MIISIARKSQTTHQHVCREICHVYSFRNFRSCCFQHESMCTFPPTLSGMQYSFSCRRLRAGSIHDRTDVKILYTPEIFYGTGPKKWWVCRCFSFSKSLFSGSMLVFNFRGCKILFAKSQAYPRVHRLETFATFRLLGLAAASACIVGAALMGATTGSVPGGPGWGAGVFFGSIWNGCQRLGYVVGI